MPRQQLFTCTCVKIYLCSRSRHRLRDIPPLCPNRRNVGLIQPRRLWIRLEIISENSNQVSSIQQISLDNSSRVEFGNVTMYRTIDPCWCLLFSALLRHMTALGSALNLEKPSKPDMIIGQWFLNFRSLAGLYAVYKHSESHPRTMRRHFWPWRCKVWASNLGSNTKAFGSWQRPWTLEWKFLLHCYSCVCFQQQGGTS
jgi:hypothetical protein